MSQEDPAQLFNDALDALDQGEVEAAIAHLEAFLTMELMTMRRSLSLPNQNEPSVGWRRGAPYGLVERSPGYGRPR